MHSSITGVTRTASIRVARTVGAALAALLVGVLAACDDAEQMPPTIEVSGGPFAAPPSALTYGTVKVCADTTRTLGLSVTAAPGVGLTLERTEITLDGADCEWVQLLISIGPGTAAGTYGVAVRAEAYGFDTLQRSFDVVVLSTGPVRFEDTEFAPADWSLSTLQIGAGGPVSAAHHIDGGAPDAWRDVRIALDDAAPDSPAAAYAFNAFVPARYAPARQGAITSIDYFETLKAVAPSGDPQASALLAVQDGETYFATAEPIGGVSWVTRTATGLGPAQFTWLSGTQPGRSIDFSAGAAPIQFGYIRSASTGAGRRGYTVTSGIDNWAVQVNR